MHTCRAFVYDHFSFAKHRSFSTDWPHSFGVASFCGHPSSSHVLVVDSTVVVASVVVVAAASVVVVAAAVVVLQLSDLTAYTAESNAKSNKLPSAE